MISYNIFGDIMDFNKDKYIIVEIIPTRSNSKDGFIAQISALKLEGLKLIDNYDLLNMIQYDKKSFTYVDNKYFIMEKFKRWAKDWPLLLINNTYTLDYLSEFDNNKELVYPYLGLEFHPNVFDDIVNKYKLEYSHHLVDLIYEAIIYEGNNRK